MSYDDNVYKSIVQFYTKSKNLKALESFLKDFLIMSFRNQKLEDCFRILEK
jgi:hypothetical protein